MLRARNIIEALWYCRDSQPVEAITPNGTYTFDVVAVEGTKEHPVLRLVEKHREPPLITITANTTDTATLSPEGMARLASRWNRVHRGAR